MLFSLCKYRHLNRDSCVGHFSFFSSAKPFGTQLSNCSCISRGSLCLYHREMFLSLVMLYVKYQYLFHLVKLLCYHGTVSACGMVTFSGSVFRTRMIFWQPTSNHFYNHKILRHPYFLSRTSPVSAEAEYCT